MGIAIMDAGKLAKQNKRIHDRLTERHAGLVEKNRQDFERLEDLRREVFDELVRPFAEALRRTKSVDLVDLESIGDPVTESLADVELREVRMNAAGAVGALSGGLVAGAGTGAVAFAAVGAFATASTGAAISGLSGAAATSATLAWLGGGSVAAGGGGVAAGQMVLAGLVAAPAAVALAAFVSWQGRRLRRSQREVSAQLRTVEAELRVAEERSRAVRERSGQVRRVLRDLATLVGPRLAAYQELLEHKDDYRDFDSAERADLAVLASLVTTTVAVLATPVADENGIVTDLSRRVVDDARLRLKPVAASA